MTTLENLACFSNQTFVKTSKKFLNRSSIHFTEISRLPTMWPEPQRTGGAWGGTPSYDTCPHVGAGMIQAPCSREERGLAFVPFSSPISCLSTKLLWRWILGRVDTDRWVG